MSREMERRLRKLEGGSGGDEPRRMVSFIPLTDERQAEIWANWRAEVAAGRATLSTGTLYVLAPTFTTAEWLASVAHNKVAA